MTRYSISQHGAMILYIQQHTSPFVYPNYCPSEKKALRLLPTSAATAAATINFNIRNESGCSVKMYNSQQRLASVVEAKQLPLLTVQVMLQQQYSIQPISNVNVRKYKQLTLVVELHDCLATTCLRWLPAAAVLVV